MSKKNKKKGLWDYLNTDCVESSDNDEAMPWDEYQISNESDEDDFQSVSEDDLFESRSAEHIPDDSELVSDEDFMRLTDMFQKRASEKKVVQEEKWSDIPFDSDDSLFDLVQEKIVEKKTSSKQNNAAPSKLFQKKKEGKKNTLHLMEKALLDEVILISHDDGLYYFNGRCYSAIRDSTELLRLIRDKVSETAFEVGSLKPCNDLHPFLKSSSNLIPNHYEEKLEKAKKLIALKDGVLNVKNLEVKSFDPKYLLFHSIDASWTKEYPTNFMRFIKQSCQYDEEAVELTLEMIGYLLSGSNRGKVFFVIGMARDSGKSTLANLLKKLIGDEFVCAIAPHQLGERFIMGDTRGKILNLAMDIPKGKLSASVVSRLKSITGGDVITIEAKYMRPEATVSNLRFLLGTNYPVTIPKEDDDDAFWQRMVVIPFTRTTPSEEKDPELLDKLWKERDAIVSHCLRKYKNVLDRGYQFSYCQASEDMKNSWRRDDASCYTFASFWTDYVSVTGNSEDEVFVQTLYDRYTMYCQDRGVEPIYYNKMREWIESHTDAELCRAKRIHKTGSNPRAGYGGIKLCY